jgi:hypothetical protein
VSTENERVVRSRDAAPATYLPKPARSDRRMMVDILAAMRLVVELGRRAARSGAMVLSGECLPSSAESAGRGRGAESALMPFRRPRHRPNATGHRGTRGRTATGPRHVC